MSTVIASATMLNSGGVTRADLFRKLALDTGLLSVGTITDGDTQYFYDTNQLKSGQLSAAEWIGGWFRVSYTPTHAAPEGEIRPIVDFEPELGRGTLEPFLSSTLTAGDKYELWKINPTIAKDLTDQCLTNELFIPCWTVLSEVPDYDMEQTGTTYWTAGGSATVSKQTADPRLSSGGKQYLRVVSGAAGDYARSSLLRVNPGKTVHVSAAVRCSAASTTAKLVLYDETNGVVLQSYTSTQLFPARIWFTFLIPSTCYSVSIRLTNVESGVTTEWDEVIFYAVSSSDIPLPWWVRNADQVKGIFELQAESIGQQLWDTTLRGEDDARFDVIPNFGGGSRFKAQAREGYLDWPLFIYGSRNETTYADDNVDTKYIDINLLCACLKWKLYKFHSQPLVTGLLDAENFKGMLGDVTNEWMLLSQSQSVELNKTVDSPTPWVRYSNPRFSYGES